jgi:hypothetical protein
VPTGRAGLASRRFTSIRWGTDEDDDDAAEGTRLVLMRGAGCRASNATSEAFPVRNTASACAVGGDEGIRYWENGGSSLSGRRWPRLARVDGTDREEDG